MPPLSRPQAWLVLMILFLNTTDLICSGCNSGSRDKAGVEADRVSRIDMIGSSLAASAIALGSATPAALQLRLPGERGGNHGTGDLRKLAHHQIECCFRHSAPSRRRPGYFAPIIARLDQCRDGA